DPISSVRVNLTEREFEVTGSEAFVEKMIGALRELLPAAEEPEDDTADEDDDDSGAGHKRVEDLDDFVESFKITDKLPGTTRILAFVYYLTKIKREADCSPAEVTQCFAESGIEEPDNLRQLMSHLKKNGLLTTAGTARYKITGKGSKQIKALRQS
ncbi:MAG TPA: hypothetical protein VMG98_12250, partial [Verrucomicrobiae bacterium]|nr:hypothetical protein [Verrucomicrobiae bacterium]